MPELTPAAIDVPNTHPDDPRVGQLLGEAVTDPKEAQVVIVGFPSDEGVRINGGRPGAAGGPDAIRQQLYRFTTYASDPQRFQDLLRHTVCLGDLQLTGSLEENQEALGALLAPYLKKGILPIILGGGHETAFAHFSGYVEGGLNVSILNWDAHMDVRPLRNGRAHSGSPFRQAIEHPSNLLRKYVVAGVLGHSAALTHVRYIRENGGNVLWRGDLRASELEPIYRRIEGVAMVTFDLDAVDQTLAPGVSAPACGGLTTNLWLRAAYLAGRSSHITSFDICELNPRFDRDDQTARLAALAVWYFLRGLSERGV